MPAKQREIMQLLYGHDIWEGFVPGPVTEVEGWNGNHPSLTRLQGASTGVAIDVGVWKGLSTITLAMAMQQNGIDGCVIAVDTFLGSSEHWQQGQGELFHRWHGRPDIFESFLSNVFHAGVCDYVVPLAQTSTAAATILKRFGIRASIVHIDAAHEYQEVLRDAEEYWQLVEPGGYLIGDDYHFTWGGVIKAAGEFSAKHVLALSVEFPKWIVQKPVG